MEPTPSLTETDRREALIARADEELAHAHELITSTDEQIARVHEQLSKLEREAFRRGASGRRLSLALRGLTSVLLAAFICLAAIAWHSSYGDAARLNSCQGGAAARVSFAAGAERTSACKIQGQS